MEIMGCLRPAHCEWGFCLEDGKLEARKMLKASGEDQSSANRFLHKRGVPCLFVGGQRLQIGGWAG